MAAFLEDVIDLNDLRGYHYYEPFAGGAALALLQDNVVSEIHINDADTRVHAFWQSVLSQNERFAELISRIGKKEIFSRRSKISLIIGMPKDTLTYAKYSMRKVWRSLGKFAPMS